MKFLMLLKIVGLLVIMGGLLATLLEYTGVLKDKSKINLSKRIRQETEGIPRSARGFGGFLKRFPPPPNVDPATVTHITKDVLQTHDQFPISITLRYVANGVRTAPVANYEQVQQWVEETPYRWVSLSIGIVGWLVAAFAVICEIIANKRPT